jgi:hypothetical protein
MIRALISIGVLIWAAFTFGIWTTVGVCVLGMFVLFLFNVGLASYYAKTDAKRERAEKVATAKADYIAFARERQQFFKRRLCDDQRAERECLAWIEQQKHDGDLAGVTRSIQDYEQLKRNTADTEKMIAGFKEQECQAIENGGTYDELCGGWWPNKERRETWREARRQLSGTKTILVFLILLAAFAGSKMLRTQTPTPAVVKPASIMILPPVEYDHHYEGDLTIQIIDTFEELYALCGQRNSAMLACAYPAYDDNLRSCRIIMVNDKLMRQRGWTTGLLFRHEQGHCNGWPGYHPGQRSIAVGSHWVAEAQRIKVPFDRIQQAEQAKAGAPR